MGTNTRGRALTDSVALITGAGHGIGRATAVAFADHGAAVAITDIDGASAEGVAAEIVAQGGRAIGFEADVADESAVEAMVARVVDEFGRLDAACNNAGIEGAQDQTADYTLDDWNRVLSVNLTGQWLCMRAELRTMLDQEPDDAGRRGSIVNVASILGRVGFAGAPAYTAAKHGLIGLTRTAALEYAERGIRINAVCPAFIHTPMLERAGVTSSAEAEAGIRSLHPIGRLGEPSEVADAIVWLCSGRATFVTGHPLMVDGGYVAR